VIGKRSFLLFLGGWGIGEDHRRDDMLTMSNIAGAPVWAESISHNLLKINK
jgi:hypothetical protein